MPPHEIKGATPVDQAWIDDQIDTGQELFGWDVKPRPPGLDKPPPLPKPAPKKPTVRERMKLWPTS